MYINKHNCFFGIYPFIWSTLTALANTSAKFSNHSTQVEIISVIVSSISYVGNDSNIERVKPL